MPPSRHRREPSRRRTLLRSAGIGCLALAGCVGPKATSTKVVDSFPLRPIEPGRDVKLRPLDETGMRFVRKLAAEMSSRSDFYGDVDAISASGDSGDDLLVECKRIGEGDPGKGVRVLFGGQAFYAVAGRVVDLRRGEVVALFQGVRSGTGGALGAGGLLAAGSEELQDSLTGWLAEDLAAELDELGEDRR